MKVLIVDDMKDNLDMLGIILRSRSYTVKAANNGKEALDMLRAEPFDLIISDILMPVMDGFQLCKACKMDDAIRNIPFVFYTATYIDKKDEEFALSMGASRFLVKPQEPHVILSTVESVMKEHHSLDEAVSGKSDIPNEEVYRMYSERLINKLEKKMQDLEKEIAFRKQIEKELIVAKERAEQADRLKSAFLANISHEIRTPLNGIIGFSSLLKEINPDVAQATRFVDIIVRSGQRLTSIIADIIEISKLETGQVTLCRDEVDVKALLDSIYDEMTINVSKEQAVRLVKDYSGLGVELHTAADKTKLAQVLTNLVSNAIKYTREGNITIGATFNNGNEITFFVSDTGIGIHEDYHEIIFERFRQVHDSSPIFQSGTGLGLAISKSYVELMGGRISLYSEYGKGSRFMFNIPYNPFVNVDVDDDDTFDFKKCNLTNRLILVVEDDDDNYDFMEESLRARKANILWAKDGQSAVKYVQERPDIDLVMMDIRMPVMDGLEATKKILKIRSDLPVVAQTAYAYSDDKVRALEAGCIDIITKPFTVQEFIGAICRHIGVGR